MNGKFRVMRRNRNLSSLMKSGITWYKNSITMNACTRMKILQMEGNRVVYHEQCNSVCIAISMKIAIYKQKSTNLLYIFFLIR